MYATENGWNFRILSPNNLPYYHQWWCLNRLIFSAAWINSLFENIRNTSTSTSFPSTQFETDISFLKGNIQHNDIDFTCFVTAWYYIYQSHYPGRTSMEIHGRSVRRCLRVAERNVTKGHCKSRFHPTYPTLVSKARIKCIAADWYSYARDAPNVVFLNHQARGVISPIVSVPTTPWIRQVYNLGQPERNYFCCKI